MKIKDYRCKCGKDDFFFADKGNQKGIYCSYCGKWLEWADKDEQNLAMKQEPKTGRWIEERNDYGEIIHWHCSNCYEDSGFTTTCKWDYCPNCGSDNREVEE